ncbi:TGF-beta-activated kinase 1 and MAP3K7-binding protein 2, partial [Stegodyphus mimosarum]
MELAGQSHPFLFYQMLQMFPNIPHDIIQMYTTQYANDAELCAQMLSLQSSKYTPAEDVDLHTALISQQLTDLKLDSYVVVPRQVENDNGTMNSSSSLPNMHFPSISDHSNANNEISLDLFPLQLPDVKYDGLYARCFNSESIASDEISNVVCEAMVDDFKDNSNGKQNAKDYRSCPSSLKEHFPNELYINVEADDENLHSWRPNMTLNSLSSDFFLTQPTFSNYSDLNLYPFANSSVNRGECNLPNNKILHMEDSKGSKPSHVENRSSVCDVYRNVVLEEESRTKNIQSYLNIQRAQVNILRYEIMKTKLDIQRYKEEVARMTQELKKKLPQDTQDIEKISKENAKLRLECQCLCMEVDFYLKGKAPLGDVNENVYEKSRVVPESEMCSDHLLENTYGKSEESCNEEDDELNKWECKECTFMNHPAINSCEICHVPRTFIESLICSSDSFFCHSN